MNLLITYRELYNHPDPILEEFSYGDSGQKAKRIMNNVKKGDYVFFHTNMDGNKYITSYYVVDRVVYAKDAIKDENIVSKYKNPHILEHISGERTEKDNDVVVLGDPNKSRILTNPILFDKSLAQKLSLNIKFSQDKTELQSIGSATRPLRELSDNDVNILLGKIESLESGTEHNNMLKVIDNENEIEDAQKRFLEIFQENSDKKVWAKASFQGGHEESDFYWSESLGYWMTSLKLETRYWNGFGIEEPQENKGHTITCEINFPLNGINRRIAAAFAKDENGEVYVVHRGKLGGNYSKEFFEINYRGKWMELEDGDQINAFVLIGKLNDPDLPQKVKEFVYDIHRMKNNIPIPNIRSFLEQILNGYLNATKQSFNKKHPMFKLIEYEFKDYLNKITSSSDFYISDASAGHGGWTNLPWVAVFNKEITNSAQEGFYPVYLFSKDMKIAYLSLNQGTKKLRDKLGFADAKSELELKASKFRNKLKSRSIITEFDENIDLRADNSYSGRLYEAGNIYAKKYDADNLPSEEKLESDLKEVLELYNSLNSFFRENIGEKIRNNNTRVWKITPGNSEEREIFWPLYKKEGFIGIGWMEDSIDYSEFNSVNEIKEALSKYYEHYNETNPTFAAFMIWNFTNEIKKGDWIVANGTSKKIIGIGIVTSDYIGPYNGENPHLFDYFEHLRKVNWLITDELEFQNALFDRKTITEIDEDKWKKIKTAYIKRSRAYRKIFDEIERNNIPKTGDQKQNMSEDIDILALHPEKLEINLKLNPRILDQVCGTLNAGKHMMLTGVPGTGKTDLAECVCNIASSMNFTDGHVLTTATSDWTTFDTIGGYMPDETGKLHFEEGKFLQSIRENKWLIIDEINRADIDKAFGQLFTVLSGQGVELPYKNNGKSIIIECGDKNKSYYSSKDSTYYVGKNWRILATMNVYDKDYLFEMSYAFMRRFTFIYVDLPDENDFKDLISSWCDGLEPHYVNSIQNLLKINEYRHIGPAIFKDISEYIKERKKIGSTDYVLNDAVLSYILPQFEGLEKVKVLGVWKILKEIFEDNNELKIRLEDIATVKLDES